MHVYLPTYTGVACTYIWYPELVGYILPNPSYIHYLWGGYPIIGLETATECSPLRHNRDHSVTWIVDHERETGCIDDCGTSQGSMVFFFFEVSNPKFCF